jgi:eukaryotic-like serine/threonine-protein kinase
VNAEQWERIAGVFQQALEMPAEARAAFLDQACAGDDALRRNVERLLAAEAEPSLTSPLYEILGGGLELEPGQVLAHYRVEEKIGEGGMGAVYRAHDERLQRKVALKVLAPARFSGAERERRLLREARAASSLSHPNIVTIYEVGSHAGIDFIAMECVRGVCLDRMIPTRGMEAAKVLPYAVQMADAVAAAHAAGILHRDLKPSNVMVTEEGRVKVLDFGLAKMMDAEAAGTPDATEEGTVAGTASYMSPEQAEGRKLDHRSDVFSFGSLLYEMTTGRKPFTADSRLALLTAIVTAEPRPPGEVAPLPADLAKLILRCLRKEPDRRYQTMADVRAALQDMMAASGPPRSRRRVVLTAVAGVAVLAAMAAITPGVLRRAEPAAGRTVKFTITPANLLRGGNGEIDAEVSISRDGKHIAYVESQAGQLWIRDIDSEQAQPVPGATGVYQVFWSPDSLSIGYSAGAFCGGRPGCKLTRIPVGGGTPVPIAELKGAFRRAYWSSDGKTIVFCDTTGMYTVPAAGGAVTRILEHPHIEHPSLLDLPHGRHAYLYQAVDVGDPGHVLYVQVAGEERRRRIASTTSTNPYPAYSPTGHIVYVDGPADSPSIWALPFSLDSLQATGKAFRIVPRGSSPMLSATGSLVYSDVPSSRFQLKWVDRAGATLSTIGEPDLVGGPVLSRDGRKLAVDIRGKTPDLWIYDLDRGMKSRLTSDPRPKLAGAWSASGDELTYTRFSGQRLELFAKSVDPDGEPRLLVSDAAGATDPDWSLDGKVLLYSTPRRIVPGSLLYRRRREDGTSGDAELFLNGKVHVGSARFSPDGRYVAYVSDESGKYEVYVRDFPAGRQKWQVSSNGGVTPRWRGDGREMFYTEGRKLMAVSVSQGPAFVPGPPAVLFEKPQLRSIPYDVAPDGKRFVILDTLAGEPPLAVHVVHNWFEEFRGK